MFLGVTGGGAQSIMDLENWNKAAEDVNEVFEESGGTEHSGLYTEDDGLGKEPGSKVDNRKIDRSNNNNAAVNPTQPQEW